MLLSIISHLAKYCTHTSIRCIGLQNEWSGEVRALQHRLTAEEVFQLLEATTSCSNNLNQPEPLEALEVYFALTVTLDDLL